jgi:Mg2+ and Co2+ transporter CorA
MAKKTHNPDENKWTDVEAYEAYDKLHHQYGDNLRRLMDAENDLLEANHKIEALMEVIKVLAENYHGE